MYESNVGLNLKLFEILGEVNIILLINVFYVVYIIKIK